MTDGNRSEPIKPGIIKQPSRGLRLAVAITALLFPTLITLVYFVALDRAAPAAQQTAYAVGKLLQFGLPIVWVLAVDRRRFGLSRPTAAGLMQGLLFGLVVLAGMLTLYFVWLEPTGLFATAANEVRQKVAGFGIHSLAAYVAMAAFYSVVHSFLEEYYWRWFAFAEWRELLPLWIAILLSGVGFMAHHVIVLAAYFGWLAPATWIFSLSVAVGGFVWAWLYHGSRSIAGPWLSHLLVDAGIFVIGYDLIRESF